MTIALLSGVKANGGRGVRGEVCLVGGWEGEGGEGVAREAGFLIVALHARREPALVAGREVSQAERGVGVLARRVHEPLAVGTQLRAHPRAGRVGSGVRFARLAIEDADRPAE